MGKELRFTHPYTAQEPSIVPHGLAQVGALNYKYQVKQRNSNIIKLLSPCGTLIIMEATLIRLTQILWRYEAKTYTNISYEGLQGQIIHIQGQKSESERKNENCNKTGVMGNSVISQATEVRSI